jgi:hypothetical protein
MTEAGHGAAVAEFQMLGQAMNNLAKHQPDQRPRLFLWASGTTM